MSLSTPSGISAWATAQPSGLARSTGCVCCLSTTTRTQEKPLDTTLKSYKQSLTHMRDIIGHMMVAIETLEALEKLGAIQVKDLASDQLILSHALTTLTMASRLLGLSFPNAGSTLPNASVD